MDFITLMPIEAYSMPSSTFVPDDSHVMVINTARDMEWDDFGGGWSDQRTKTLQARTNAYKQWLLNYCKPAASPTDTGITFMENGVCHTAANRILIVSDGDTNVRLAPGDEYAILFFGKYGLGISDFKKKLKDSFNYSENIKYIRIKIGDYGYNDKDTLYLYTDSTFKTIQSVFALNWKPTFRTVRS